MAVLKENAFQIWFALLCGLTGAATRRKGQAWPEVIISGIAAGVIGVIVGFICRHYAVDESLTYAMVGLSSMAGTNEVMGFLRAGLKSRLNITTDTEKSDADH